MFVYDKIPRSFFVAGCKKVMVAVVALRFTCPKAFRSVSKNYIASMCCITIGVLFFLCFTSGTAYGGNAEKRKAYQLYDNAREAYMKTDDGNADKKTCLEIEQELIEAIEIVPDDTQRLHYEVVEQRLIPGTGRWVEYEDVRISYDKKYFPNRLLSRIRQRFPPRPMAVINIVDAAYGKQSVVVEIFNRGKTRMENLRVGIRNDSWRSDSKTISVIKPGERRQLKWTVSEIGICSIRFKEKFNYAPRDLSLGGNRGSGKPENKVLTIRE
ncbi:MAG: hypothetical protein ACQERN_04810 [Thermodesulfobacteriota bacterium]